MSETQTQEGTGSVEQPSQVNAASTPQPAPTQQTQPQQPSTPQQQQMQIPHSSAGTITNMQTGLPLVPLQHSSAGTITMSALQHHQQQQAIQGQQNQAVQQQQIQQLGGWGHDRVQVIQQPQLSNSGSYVQYATAAPGLMMNGNIAIQNPNGQTIQLIAGGKPIQSNQLATASHMFQGKQVITAQGQTASFPNFTQIPTSNQQTLIIGNLPNIPNIIPQPMTAVATSKPQEIQKGAQPLFSQWQIQVPQNVWAATAPNSQPTLIAQNGSMAYTIRGPQPPDGSGQVQQTQVFVQSPPPQHIQAQHVQGIAQTQIVNATPNALKRPQDNLQPKIVTARQLLPSNNTSGIRPGSSVSTQTTPTVQMTTSMVQKSNKVRAKAYMSRAGSVQMAAQKQQIMVQQQQQQQPQQLAQPTITFQQQQQMIQPKPVTPSPLLMSTQPPIMPVVSMPTIQQQTLQQPLQQPPQIVQPAIVTSGAQTINTVTATPTTQQPVLVSTAPISVESQSDKAQAVEGMLTLSNSVESENAPVLEEGNKVALVKPQILTHLIDGHVILESDEPFPIVYESSITNQATNKNEKEKLKSDGNSSPAKKLKTDLDEINGKESTKKPKRTANYKKMNGEVKNGENLSESQDSSSSEKKFVNDAKTSDSEGSKVDPTKWSVSDVYEFVRQIPDEHCNAYASNFAFQEIDGQALMLLNEKVMVKVMEMKVGPALKILAEINKMREDSSDPPEET